MRLRSKSSTSEDPLVARGSRERRAKLTNLLRLPAHPLAPAQLAHLLGLDLIPVTSANYKPGSTLEQAPTSNSISKMVQPSRTSLNALTALVRLQPSPLPSSLSSRLAIALQSFHPSSPSTSAQIPWSAFHPILQDVLAALPAGSQQRDEFRALLVRVEGEMKGEEKKEEVLSHSSGGQSGMVEMKSNGLVPGPAEADEETQEIEQGTAAVTLDPPAPQDQLPEVEIPPTLLPLILSALSSTASNLAAKERKELGNVSLLTTLALKPTLILPPGKTLASLLSLSGAEEEARERKRKRRVSEGSGDEGKERRGEGVGGLEERVGKMMRKAFWDDVSYSNVLFPGTSS